MAIKEYLSLNPHYLSTFIYLVFFFMGALLVPDVPVHADESDTQSNMHSPDYEEMRQELEELRQKVNELMNERDVRKALEAKDQKIKEAETILSSTGRNYTLLPRHVLGVEYSFSYAYYSYFSLLTEDGDDVDASTGDTDYDLIRYLKFSGNHVTDHSFFIEYGFLDNLTFHLDLPFTVRSEDQEGNHSKSVSDIGDVRIGFQYQPIRPGGRIPAMTLSATLSCPTGKSPYEIDVNSDISTGNGYYALSSNISLSQAADPLILFGHFGYTVNFDTTSANTNIFSPRELSKISPGDVISFSLGFAMAITYNISINMSYQYAYQLSSSYNFDGETTVLESSPSVSSQVNMGTGFRFSKKRTVNTRISVGLTEDDPDFTILFMIPLEFSLGK